LPATARDDALSRIVVRLEGGVVTTARSDADIIVTEFGAAELRGQSLAERVRRMVAISHPNHRETLEREAREWFGAGGESWSLRRPRSPATRFNPLPVKSEMLLPKHGEAFLGKWNAKMFHVKHLRSPFAVGIAF